jgi:hypothetical protein
VPCRAALPALRCLRAPAPLLASRARQRKLQVLAAPSAAPARASRMSQLARMTHDA